MRDKDDKVIASNDREGGAGAAASTSSTTETQMLEDVIRAAPAPRPQLGDGSFEAGKTGTTENYGDAWFVGFNEFYTVAVWVGYSNGLQADAHRVRRLAGGRRHLSRADLAPVHGGARWASSTSAGSLDKLSTDKPDRLLAQRHPGQQLHPGYEHRHVG